MFVFGFTGPPPVLCEIEFPRPLRLSIAEVFEVGSRTSTLLKQELITEKLTFYIYKIINVLIYNCTIL